MEPCRKCGKALECVKHFSINTRASSDMFEGQKSIRSTSSVSHRPCPYCGDPKPLFAYELKTYIRTFLRLLVAASLCGLYFLVNPQIFDSANQSMNSFLTLTIGGTGGLFLVFAIINGVTYLMKKDQGVIIRVWSSGIVISRDVSALSDPDLPFAHRLDTRRL